MSTTDEAALDEGRGREPEPAESPESTTNPVQVSLHLFLHVLFIVVCDV